MCLFKVFFKRRTQKEDVAIQEPWFNDQNAAERGSFFKTTRDPYSGKKKKPMMDPVHNRIPGGTQDANTVRKSGV